jgi:hypothetical protein
LIVLAPYGFDHLADGPRAMRFDRLRTMGVWSNGSHEQFNYAAAVCDWWEGVAPREAA